MSESNATTHLKTPCPGQASSQHCTVLCSVGNCSLGRHGLVAENRDVASVGAAEIMVAGNPEGGNRYLGISTDGNPSSLTIGINEKGVISGMAARYCHPMSAQGIPAGVIINRCLQSAGSAEEMAAQIQAIIRTEGKNRAGSAFSCADYRELYVVEGYKKASEIFGPLKDTVFAYANYALTDRLKRYEKVSRGHQRATQAFTLLDQHRGALTVPFLIRFCRDHEHPPDTAYTWDDRNICTHGFGNDTRGSGICLSHRKYPHLLSVLWSAFNQPCKTPYVPFYIGINRLPKVYTHAEAYTVFENLAVLLEYYPEYQTAVRTYWEAFEMQTLREGENMEKRVAELAEGRRTDAARELLTGFVAGKADRAVADAFKITKKIKRDGRRKKHGAKLDIISS